MNASDTNRNTLTFSKFHSCFEAMGGGVSVSKSQSLEGPFEDFKYVLSFPSGQMVKTPIQQENFTNIGQADVKKEVD